MSHQVEEECYPIGVLIEELQCPDIIFRIQSIKKLTTIALALGPEKTRSQLLPFLTDSIYDEEKVLLALAKQLGSLVSYVGGAEYAHSILPPLETLVSNEEIAVREKAIKELRKLSTYLSNEAMEKYFNPMVHRLATGDWLTSRSSACALIHVIYPRVRYSKRVELLTLFNKLSLDQTPMVRRAIASHVSELALFMSSKAFSSDDNTSVDSTCDVNKVSNPTNLNNTDPTTTPATTISTSQSMDTQMNPATSSESSTAANIESAKLIDEPDVLNTFEDPSLVGKYPKVPTFKDPSLIDFGKDPKFLFLNGDQFATGSDDDTGPTILPQLPPQLSSSIDPDSFAFDSAMEQFNLFTQLALIFKKLVDDEQESVRLAALESIAQMAKALGSDRALDFLKYSIRRAKMDKSWRVRCVVADKLTDLQIAIGQPVDRDFLPDIFINLLRDEEAEVRAYAAAKIHIFARLLLELPTSPPSESSAVDSNVQPDPLKEMDETEACQLEQRVQHDSIIMHKLLPTIHHMISESNTHVKSALAESILGLAPIIGCELTKKHLSPIFLAQLNDENSEVRLNVIAMLEQVNKVIGLDQLGLDLLPSIIELAEDPKWRIRLATIVLMPLLAKQLGQDRFGMGLVELCLKWLVDQVYTIREVAVDNLVQLCKLFGASWTSQHFVPKILVLSQDSNYLHRMICLQCIISLCGEVNSQMFTENLLPTVLSMHTDKVPNVRFKVAQCLSTLGSYLDSKLVQTEIHTCLNHLLEDHDSDVRFYAYEALDQLHLPIANARSFFAHYDHHSHLIQTSQQQQDDMSTAKNDDNNTCLLVNQNPGILVHQKMDLLLANQDDNTNKQMLATDLCSEMTVSEEIGPTASHDMLFDDVSETKVDDSAIDVDQQI